MNAVPASQRKEWTEEELQALPDNGFDDELADGVLVRRPKNSFQHGDLCGELLMGLRLHPVTHKFGKVCDSSTGFWIIDPETESAEICHSLMDRRLLNPNGELNGENLLPGVRCQHADLFAGWSWE